VAARSGRSSQATARDGASGLTALRPALLRLDLRLRLVVDAFRDQLAERARDPFRGLYISESDVDELLAAVPSAELSRRLLGGAGLEAAPRLARLAERFELDSFEQEALLVCLAPDLDLRYERLYAYLQDDATRRRPTVDLVLRLLEPLASDGYLAARAALGPDGRLVRRGLIAAERDDAAVQGSLLARPLRVEERVVDFLLGSDRLDPRVALFGELHPPSATPAAGPLRVPAGLLGMLRRAGPPNGAVARVGPVVYLQGAPGAGKRTAARAAAAAADRALLMVDVASLLAGADEPTVLATLTAALREALLQDAVVCLDGVDLLLADAAAPATVRSALHRMLLEHADTTLMLGEARWEPSVWLVSVPALRIELSALGPGARAELWRARLDGHLPAEAADDLAARYRLVEDESIRTVSANAASRAALRGDPAAGLEDFQAAARTVSTPPLEGLARRVDPRYGWDDIVLGVDGLAQLHELCARLRHQARVMEQWGFGQKHARRGGLTALFVGAPGTGKTMAAEIIAGELGLDLYRIDLSAVVSKYIGETEKNLERVFRAADQGDAVLLFDEADALFGKRSETRDAHDRHANVQVAYLLQRLETYDGLAILTSNLRGNIDEAFVRRLDVVLEFPLPEEAERLRIWGRALPREAPLGDDVDLPFLAGSFKLAGGHIRNIALTAAFLAAAADEPIAMRHLVRATRREHQKLGKLIAESEFGRYYALLKESNGVSDRRSS
jgi:SpoVK/Ycf46/Vps4 family AAA+-type ATPase